jgi:hypothetical protein
VGVSVLYQIPGWAWRGYGSGCVGVDDTLSRHQSRLHPASGRSACDMPR